ncbi:MAG: hypothetical protein ACFHU9_08500 [Fluviicola sp.]
MKGNQRHTDFLPDNLENINRQKIIFFCLLFLLLLSKTFILVRFSTAYTSNDDVIFWQGARDYASAIFYEPYFYGQNYNFMLESLLAAPFLWLGIPVYWAVPLSTTILATFPFVLFASEFFRRRLFIGAYIFLSIPILISIEYDILSSLSRGFVSGIFFCSFLVYPILEPKKIRSFIIFGLAASFGFIMNPNSVIFSVPVGIYLLSFNFSNYRFYALTAVSALPALTILYFSKSFYSDNPEYVVHGMWELIFKWKWIGEAFNYLDLFFTGITPIFWSGNWIILPILLILAIVLYRKNKRHSLVVLFALTFIIITFGINKVHDGKDWIFFSSTRMYLAVPLLLGLALHWASKAREKRVTRYSYLFLVVAAATISIKQFYFPVKIKELDPHRDLNILHVSTIDALENDCGQISSILDQHPVDLVVFVPHWSHSDAHTQLLNYGCSFMDSRLNASVISLYERRTWKFNSAIRLPHRNVLLYGYDLANKQEVLNYKDARIVHRNPDMVLITNNRLPLKQLTSKFKIKMKRK